MGKSKRKRIPQKLQPWIDARRRFRLSHAQVQMARELGLNPKKMGGYADHTQQPWKLPLPQFIEELYRKHFGRDRPERVLSIEELAAEIERKKAEKRERKRLRREAEAKDDARDGDPEAENDSPF